MWAHQTFQVHDVRAVVADEHHQQRFAGKISQAPSLASQRLDELQENQLIDRRCVRRDEPLPRRTWKGGAASPTLKSALVVRTILTCNPPRWIRVRW
jgi:hypothetical protein